MPLIQGQVGDANLVSMILRGMHPGSCFGPVDAAIHFTAYAYVGESMRDPARYYRNNLADSLTLLELLVSEGLLRTGSPLPILFSGTCATYGIPDFAGMPIEESCPQKPVNPYGRSKWMIEQVILDFNKAYGMPSVILRYFNAAGAEPSADLGEDHTPETHLIPLTLKVISGSSPYLEIMIPTIRREMENA